MELTLTLFKTTKNYAVYQEEVDTDLGQCLPDESKLYLSQDILKGELEMDEVPDTLIVTVRAG